jgi:hypothetical protein
MNIRRTLFACFVLAAMTSTVSAQSRQLTPGEYEPVFQEIGFHDKGNYFDAGFQITVNHYGGNLLVSATDIAIPSQGKFSLAFHRTRNSNRILNPSQAVIVQGNGPLGLGWTCHYGLL